MKIAGIKGLKEKIRISREARDVILEIGYFILGFLLMSTRFIFSTFPFGIALVGSGKKQTVFILSGAILSSALIMDEKVPYIIALIALTGLRISASFIKKSDYKKAELGKSQGKRIIEALFCEVRELKVALASLVALGLGIYRVIANGYAYYDIFSLVFYTVFVAVLTYCLCGFFDSSQRSDFLVGGCALLFCIAYFLSGREIGGFDLSLVLAYALVLYVSKHLGGVKACALGIILGIAQRGASVGVLGIGGLISGFIWGVSPYLSVMASFILSIGYAISIMGYEGIIHFVPEILCASLIMYPLLRFELLPRMSLSARENGDIGMSIYLTESRNNSMKKRLGALSQAYEGISKKLKDVSAKSKSPDKRGYYDIALETCEAHCYSCPKESICWRRDVGTTRQNIDKLGEALFIKKTVAKEDVEEKFLHRCPNIDSIMEELNEKSKAIVTESVKNDKLEVSAQDYEFVSKLMNCMINDEREQCVSKELTDRACRTCASCNLICDRIEVLSHEGITVILAGVDMQRSKCTAQGLRQELEKAFEVKLKEPITEESDGYTVLRIESEGAFTAESFAISKKDEKEEENGDSYTYFYAGNKYYAVICDGMGSGHEAQLTSRLCTELIQKMVSVTDEKQLILSMLNNFIRSKAQECSSSVDIFELDLFDGTGKLVKCGAAPTFIKRQDSVFKLQSKTAPIGIMKSLDAEEIAFTLCKGDICVMVSDGIATAGKECKWINEYLSKSDGDIEVITQGLLNEAKKYATSDDMTIVCTVIK